MPLSALLHLQHLLDGGHSRDRLLGESPAVGHGADHAPVDVDGRAAHPFQHSRAIHRVAAEADQDQVSLRSDVLHQPDDLGIEPGDLRPLEDRSPLPLHADLQLAEGKNLIRPDRRSGEQSGGEHQDGPEQAAHGMDGSREGVERAAEASQAMGRALLYLKS